MGLGMFDTSDNSLMVYIFGTEKSRPFTQSVHCLVGVGFVFGSALSRPFLPEEGYNGDVNVCLATENSNLGEELLKESGQKVKSFLFVAGQQKFRVNNKSNSIYYLLGRGIFHKYCVALSNNCNLAFSNSNR